MFAWSESIFGKSKKKQKLEERDLIEKEKVAILKAIERDKQQQLQLKQQLLKSQRQREETAAAKSCKSDDDADTAVVFVKSQRIRYFYKAKNCYYDDAYVVDVHLDDGPDMPYYTIHYYTNDATNQVPIEKQTTGDRLRRMEWDEEKTWKILKREKGAPKSV